MAVNDYDPIIQQAANEWNVDPNWVKAVMQQESGGNPSKNGKPITSSAGAGGLMQIMPGTASGLSPGMDVHDPTQAIFGGAKYMSQMLDQFHTVPLATAAYNAGPDRVTNYLNGTGSLKPETMAYVPAVASHYQGFQKASGSQLAPVAPASGFGPLLAVPGAPTVKGGASPPAAPVAAPGAMNDDDFLKSIGGAPAQNSGATKPNAPGSPAAGPMADEDFLKSIGGAPRVKAAGNTDYTEGAPPVDITPVPGNIPGAMAAAAVQGAKEGWQNTPDILGPQSSNWLSQHGLGVIGDNTGLPSYALKGAAAVGNALMSAGTTGIMGVANAIGDHPGVPFGLGNIPLLGRDVAAVAQNPLAVSGGGMISANGNPVPLSARDAALNARVSQIWRDNPLVSPGAAPSAATGEMASAGAPSVNPLVSAAQGRAASPLSTAPSAAVPAVQGEIPTTSAAAKAIASQHYDQADAVGGQLAPQVRNAFLDKGNAIAAEDPDATLTRGGPSPMASLMARLETTRDQPMSLAGAQGIDENLGKLIDGEYGKSLSSDGKDLLDLQTYLRDQIRSAGPGDVLGGTEGFDALNQGRQAYAQAMKMKDLEQIQTRANLTDNPATGVKSGIRTLLSNDARSRGYTDDEKAALQAAGDRGMVGGALHVFGSRLIPMAAAVGGLGLGGGEAGMMAGLGTTALHYAGSTMMRNAATALQNRRLNNAMQVLGSKVPLNPLIAQ